MSMPIDDELISCFLDEAVDTLSQWERACLDIENNPSAELYNELFRAAHNLKGASRSVGLEEFGAFVHISEDIINLLIKGELVLYAGIVTILLEAQVFLMEWVEALRKDSSYVPPRTNLYTKIELLTKRDSQPGHGKDSKPELKTVEAAAQPKAVEEDAPISGMPDNSGDIDLEALFKAASEEYLTQQVSESKVEKLEVPALKASAVNNIETVTEKKLENTEKQQQKSANDSHKNSRSDETVRVAASKLDELIQLIGELTIHQSIIFQGRRSGNLQQSFYQNAIQLSNKITKDLHGKALSLRMQPVQGLFQRLERVAKDVARAQSKKMSIVLEGTDVELDKSVIERITDPLVHVLRNAVDHGVETPALRLESRKDEVATLRLSATQDASNVRIRISDDGQGLNTKRILKKAIEKGLVKEGETLTNKEIQKLIFLPGFSTAEKVTDISGRGVGMDVVMRAVQSLQGSIDLESEEGKGSTFSIILPTTMSIVDGLIVKVNNLRYVVSMHELTEIIDLSDYVIESTGNQGKMLSLRGGVMPLEPLNKYVELSQEFVAGPTTSASKPALVVKEGNSSIAFQIDEVLGQQSVVVRPLNEQMSDLAGFSGSTVLSDGEPGMILSLSDLARQYFQHSSFGGQLT